MKAAICGVWHVHAVEYTKKALQAENVEVIGFYEEDTALREDFLKNYDLPHFSSFEALLQSDADAVIVCSSSNTHAEYMVRLAQAKKDIFTEKVLALTVEDCLRVQKAVQENGVRFVIYFVQKSCGQIRAVKKLAESGELGRLNFIRFRNCHSGSTEDWLPAHFYSRKQCGGGAMIDLGAHGMYLIDWFLGLPQKYQSAFTVWDTNKKNTDRVEDNAVTIMTYADGSLAINETGFISCGSPRMLEVGGDKGFVRLVAGRSLEKFTTETKGIPVTVDAEEDLPLPIESFLAGKTPEGCGIEEAVRLTQMMEGAYGTGV